MLHPGRAWRLSRQGFAGFPGFGLALCCGGSRISNEPRGAGMKFGIGQAVLRKEDHRLLTGGGRYLDDIKLPGEAFVYVLRSPHAHAAITSIDAETARAAPGIIAVLTGADAEQDKVAPIPCLAHVAPGQIDPLHRVL